MQEIKKKKRNKGKDLYLDTLIKRDSIDELIEILDKVKEKDPPINFYIDSPGGSVADTLFFIHYLKENKKIDKIKKIIIIGDCASAANLIFLAFPLNKRYCFEFTKMFFHPLMYQGLTLSKSQDFRDEEHVYNKMSDFMFNFILNNSSIPKDFLEETKQKDVNLMLDDLIKYKVINKKNVIKEL